MSPAPVTITLLASLSWEAMQLPFAAMRDVGPAVQTLGGLLTITRTETFSPVSDIATRARVPDKTCRNHLDQLDANGWITNAGRGHTRLGSPRRTCTIRITKKTLDSLSAETVDGLPAYGILPWWAGVKIIRGNTVDSLPWSARALLSVVLGKLASLKAAYQPGVGRAEVDEQEFWQHSLDYFGEAPWKFSLAKLHEITGLAKRTVIDGKRILKDWDIIRAHNGRLNDAGGFDHDRLEPNPDFACLKTPSGEGMCNVIIKRKAS